MSVKRVLNVGFGAARVGFGVVAGAFPEKIGRTWIGESAGSPQTRVILRALGARDVALGAGTVEAALRDDATGWLVVSTLADFGDLTATLLARRDLPRNGVLVTGLFAGSAAFAGLALLAIELNGE
ncbi:MAG TPA: hypothetical protein VMF31_09970 [Solirubrobacterales bacterium]|nr:hypothetical protein [Solirubrobacterales bacterium]